MVKRVGLTKTVRFEVFKRDGFKCQYCGATAPEVVLEVDHINPVSKGGANELLNLITACKPCNAGKSDRELSDDAAVTKQRGMLDDLNERREQLEMMLKWRDGMKDLGGQSLDAISAEWSSVAPGFHLNETGQKSARKLLREFPLATILEAVQITSEKYIRLGDDGNATAESANVAWNKVGGICRILTQGPDEKQLYYIRGICRNRFNYCNETECLSLLRDALAAGCDVDYLADIARSARNWTGWCSDMYDAISRRQQGL